MRFKLQAKNTFPMNTNAKIFLSGHKGMVGAALQKQLLAEGFQNIVTADKEALDLLQQKEVADFLCAEAPDTVILAAARVGGIEANRSEPARFLYENLAIQNNVIHGSYLAGVQQLVFLGSSCIYPRDCPQPMKESYLLSGPLEPTNEGYALAKIAGLRMVQAYHQQYGMGGICAMPCNLYGSGDCFDLKKSHVLSSLVKRFVDAVDGQCQDVTLWGSGSAYREFMHIEDLARAMLLLMTKVTTPDLINVGTGEEISIRNLAELVAETVNFRGNLMWDTTKPDGMPRKCLEISKLKALGFTPKISLTEGVHRTVEEYRQLKKSALL